MTYQLATMMSIHTQIVPAAPLSLWRGGGRGQGLGAGGRGAAGRCRGMESGRRWRGCAVRAIVLCLLTPIASLLVFRPQADGPGLPPAAGEHGPLVPEQGGHVRTSGARPGEELEEGMCQIQKVSASPRVTGERQAHSRTTRSPPSRHCGPERWPCRTRDSRRGPELLCSSQPQFATCRTRS